MFVGTPCQIHGLKLFLRKDYENLITVDFVCHGVPSPKIWKIYLNKTAKTNDIKQISFRNKKSSLHSSASKVVDIALPFITKSNPYIPNRIVHSTLVDYLILCKVHGSSQLTEILEPEFCLVGFFSPKSNTMVGKSICLFRNQPTGCYRSVSSPKDLANFHRSRKALSRQEGAP